MNEIQIYKKIKDIILKKRKMVNYAWLSIGAVGINSIIMVSLPLLEWATMVTIFVPFGAAIVFLFLSLRSEYITGKRYPMVYNKWVHQDNFIRTIESYASERAQTDPKHIKIQNHGLEYIDSNVDAYYDDKKKISNAFYNSIINTSLVDEIRFHEKYKNFIKDINSYRNNLIDDIF